MLIFHSFLSFQQNLARGQDKGCYAAQIASEKACEGFTLQKSWRTIVARQTDYLLNVMFPWMSHSGDFLPVMSTDNGWQNLTPEHICILISYKLPVLHSCPFFFFFHTFFPTGNKLHFGREREVIISAFGTSSPLWGADVLFHTSLVAYSCIQTSVLHTAQHSQYSTLPVMKCLAMWEPKQTHTKMIELSNQFISPSLKLTVGSESLRHEYCQVI